MDSIIFKVIFRAYEQFEIKNLTLSFKNLYFKEPITIPAKFIIDLKKLSETNNHVINFQNIEEVLIIGKPNVDYVYNYYIVILFEIKSDKKKEGYLIGNVKNLGDIVIGIWPFNRDLEDFSREELLETYNDIINNPNNYSSVSIITQ